MAGTYLSAPIIGYNLNELTVLSIFLIIWNISFSVTALMSKRRDIIFIASYYAVFTVLLLSGRASSIGQQTDLLVLQLIQLLVFSTSIATYSMYYKKPLSTEASFAILPALLIFYASTNHLLLSISPRFAPWFGVTIGSLILGIYFFTKNYMPDKLKSGPALTTFTTLAFVHSIYFQVLDDSFHPLASLIIGATLVIILRNKSKISTQDITPPILILLAVFAYGAILTIVSEQISYEMYLYNWIYGVFTLLSSILLDKNNKLKSYLTKHIPFILGFAHVEIMLGLYRLSQRLSSSGALFLTITWGIYASVILALAYKRSDRLLGNSALIILLAVSLKAFFYDINNTSSLVRVACLLAQGLLLYCCGWIFKKMQDWKT